ncbi:Scd6-like Sm domain-containing protein [Coniochaeta sp. 2T2.1]|nr:Scd6-like Sm domain-containing protein [Coniochaeta sp. 2T2.1]
MSEFLGARISLISRSDIRYVGTLHEINSDDSTVSLENVRSFGTEGRRGGGDDEAPPSDQIYEYIVFRGKDVKDLRVEDTPNTVKENKPPAVPDDPAIVGARARPNNLPPGPPNQQGPPGGPGFGYYPPPPMAGWGRGGAPPPMQGFGGMQYPPPPGWYGQPGQGFPPGPPAAGQWGSFPQAFPPGPGGPPGAQGAPGAPGPNNRQAPPQESRPAPICATSDRKPSTPAQQGNVAQQPKPAGPPAQQQAPAARGPPPPVDSKPTVEQVKATAASLAANGSSTATAEPTKAIRTGPKNTTRPTQIMPAVPLPAGLTAKVAQPTQAAPSNSAPTKQALDDATQVAKAAVAVAMAKMGNSGSSQQSGNPAVDNLTKKVIEMRVNAPRGDAPRGAPHTRGGGRGRGPRPAGKVEVPDADFDFASSNAKFNKEDVVKEAIATGSPLGETVPDGVEDAPEAVLETTPGSGAPPAYNKQKSFFDNISSEAKDRAESGGHKPGGREWRGEEQRKNMETFGQGSVDGGYRGGYRGRGRGRGNRGRGYGRGGAPRGGAPFRNNQETQPAS